MANISNYPLIIPKISDLVLFTETYDINAAYPVSGNPTRSATIESILDLGSGGGSGVSSINGETGVVLMGLNDLNDIASSGTVGQVLTKNGNNTYDFTTPAGNDVISVNGAIGAVSLGITDLNDINSVGTVGQVLTKNADSTYDFVTPGSVEGVIGYIGVVNGVATLRKEIVVPSDATSIPINGFGTQGITTLTLNEGLLTIGRECIR